MISDKFRLVTLRRQSSPHEILIPFILICQVLKAGNYWESLSSTWFFPHFFILRKKKATENKKFKQRGSLKLLAASPLPRPASLWCGPGLSGEASNKYVSYAWLSAFYLGGPKATILTTTRTSLRRDVRKMATDGDRVDAQKSIVCACSGGESA